jgi:Winged helix DNA-binding domain
MKASDIPAYRLYNQHLSQPNLQLPAQVVGYLGAVQSQDYAGAKWAVAQRTPGLTDAALDQALADGSILRLHVLRPTWHFVTPADVRWMLALSGSRVRALMAYGHRQVGLDAATFKKSHAAVVKALQGGKQLTRTELGVAITRAGVDITDLLRLGHIMGMAELEAIVCNGGRRGKQMTYALMDEWVRPTKPLTRDESLAELALRYFVSRGPATLPDFVWWSGLTTADCKTAIELIKPQLITETLGDQTYWRVESQPSPKEKTPKAYLLPNYDEYVVGYEDRTAIYGDKHNHKLDARGNVLFNNTIVVNGQIRGVWKRTLAKKAVVVEATPFTPFTKAEAQAVTSAAHRYGEFLELPVSVSGLEN